MGAYSFTRCIQVTKAQISLAAETREGSRALLEHLCAIARPHDGGPMVLLLFARLATAGAWLEGDLRITLEAHGDETLVDITSTLGGAAAERVFPRCTLNVPLAELEGAAARVPQMLYPLSLEVVDGGLVLAASRKQRESIPPSLSEQILAAELLAQQSARAPEGRGPKDSGVRPRGQEDAGMYLDMLDQLKKA